MILNRPAELDQRTGMSGGLMALIAAVAVLAVLFMWSPWSGPRVADNTAPGTTVGSSTRPSRTSCANRAGAGHPCGPLHYPVISKGPLASTSGPFS